MRRTSGERRERPSPRTCRSSDVVQTPGKHCQQTETLLVHCSLMNVATSDRTGGAPSGVAALGRQGKGFGVGTQQWRITGRPTWGYAGRTGRGSALNT